MQTPASIAAFPLRGGGTIQLMASRHHQQPAGTATVALIIPAGLSTTGNAPSRIVHLDVATARQVARHIMDCAAQAQLANAGPQTEREALMAAITPEELDAGVSDLVGLAEC